MIMKFMFRIGNPSIDYREVFENLTHQDTISAKKRWACQNEMEKKLKRKFSVSERHAPCMKTNVSNCNQ
jgi:hypothetical protein